MNATGLEGLALLSLQPRTNNTLRRALLKFHAHNQRALWSWLEPRIDDRPPEMHAAALRELVRAAISQEGFDVDFFRTALEAEWRRRQWVGHPGWLIGVFDFEVRSRIWFEMIAVDRWVASISRCTPGEIWPDNEDFRGVLDRFDALASDRLMELQAVLERGGFIPGAIGRGADLLAWQVERFGLTPAAESWLRALTGEESQQVLMMTLCNQPANPSSALAPGLKIVLDKIIGEPVPDQAWRRRVLLALTVGDRVGHPALLTILKSNNDFALKLLCIAALWRDDQGDISLNPVVMSAIADDVVCQAATDQPSLLSDPIMRARCDRITLASFVQQAGDSTTDRLL